MNLRLTPIALAALLSMTAPGAVGAQTGGGFYVSQELGGHFTPGLGIDAHADNAPGSICDQHLNPFTDLMPAYCDGGPDAPTTEWVNAFRRGSGVLAGAAAGYGFGRDGRLRLEAEYFFRETAYDETSPIRGRGGVAVAKLDGEVVVAEDRIGSLTSHNLFANVYYDLPGGDRVTPYVGAGGGMAFTRVDYGLLWVRNSDPDAITSVAPHFPADRSDDLRVLQSNLASTTSSLQTGLADTLGGYQLLAGLDIALGDRTTLGAKGRWAQFAGFSHNPVLDRLRSHAASNRIDGSRPVTGGVTTGDTGLLAFTANLRYRF